MKEKLGLKQLMILTLFYLAFTLTDLLIDHFTGYSLDICHGLQ